MRRFTLILLLLLPVAAFAVSLYWVNGFFDKGEIRNGMLLMLGGLAVMVALEFPLLRFVVLPRWGQIIGERIYAGSYSPAEDIIVSLAEEIRRTGDEARLPQLEALVLADATRQRAWRELADIQLNVFHRPEQAIDTLLKAEKSVRGKEDKALLLYRAAQWADSRLHQTNRARELFSLVVQRYPATVYGAKARQIADSEHRIS